MNTTENTIDESESLPSNSICLGTLNPVFKLLNAHFIKGVQTNYTGDWNCPTPLMTPTNFSAYNNSNGVIKVQVTVHINTSLNINELKVYAGSDLVESSLLPLYVIYDKPEPENEPAEVYPYTLYFEIPEALNDQQISALEICLWNEDPQTSRGTVTTVKSGVGY